MVIGICRCREKMGNLNFACAFVEISAPEPYLAKSGRLKPSIQHMDWTRPLCPEKQACPSI